METFKNLFVPAGAKMEQLKTGNKISMIIRCLETARRKENSCKFIYIYQCIMIDILFKYGMTAV